MSLKTKYDTEEIVSKNINTRKSNSKENNKSRNKVDILTREQQVKLQKGKHTPMIRNNYTMMKIIDMWDNNKLDQEKKRDMSSNMLDNTTMENTCEQLQRRHKSNANIKTKLSTDDKGSNKLDLDKKIGNAEAYEIKVFNTSKQYIIKDTNRKFKNIDIISITDNKIQGTTTITTNSNRNNTSPNKVISKAKFLCEIERLKSKNESTKNTNYIAKDIAVSNIIKNEFELTNSRNKINESDTYKDRKIFDKEKTNKHRLKTRLEN